VGVPGVEQGIVQRVVIAQQEQSLAVEIESSNGIDICRETELGQSPFVASIRLREL
jgi:hypothetical protein